MANKSWLRMAKPGECTHGLALSVDCMECGRDAWVPTQDAYDAACKALAHWRAESYGLLYLIALVGRRLS